MVEKYNHTVLGSIINTLSPNKKYFYLVSKLKSLNPSAFGMEIAFLDMQGQLVYYQKNVYAQGLRDERYKDFYFNNENDYHFPEIKEDSFELVKWSKDGSIAYIFEWKCENNNVTYMNKFIDLNKKIVYSKPYIKNENFIVPRNFEMSFFKTNILNYKKEIIVNDTFKKRYFFNKWYPRVTTKIRGGI